MVFIKGAWIDLHPWDKRYNEYYCCRYHDGLFITIDNDRPRDPYYTCNHANGRKICDKYDENDREIDGVIKPSWCPKR